jgi:peptide chain release factor subunit 1
MAAKRSSRASGELRVPSDRDLRRLARFRSPRGVLSLYLSFDPSAGERRDLHAVAIDALHALGGTARESIEGRLDEEQRRVVGFLREDFALAGRGVAIFSCQPRNLWEVFQLQVPLPALARFAERPVVAPLAAVLDDYERYAVALVDKDRARLLHVYLGRVEREVEVRDKYPGRTEMGGWAQSRYQRHRDAHLHAHLLRAAQQLQDEARRRPFDRLVVGGPDEARAAFVAVLPRGLRNRVAGTFSAELFLSESEILERVAAIEEAAEREGEVRLVSDVLDAARSGGLATSGWDDTLQALGEGRVHKLVLANGRSAKGSACPAGHFAALEQPQHCPLCRGPLEPVGDLAEWAVERALATHAVPETVDGKAAQALAAAGEIAAVLRY